MAEEELWLWQWRWWRRLSQWWWHYHNDDTITMMTMIITDAMMITLNFTSPNQDLNTGHSGGQLLPIWHRNKTMIKSNIGLRMKAKQRQRKGKKLSLHISLFQSEGPTMSKLPCCIVEERGRRVNQNTLYCRGNRDPRPETDEPEIHSSLR